MKKSIKTLCLKKGKRTETRRQSSRLSNMKKLFTLAVLTSLLAIKSWAGPYIYFTECPQLDYGTTSFNYKSVTLQTSGFSNGSNYDAWSGYCIFDGNGNINTDWSNGNGIYGSPHNIIDIGNDKFSNVAEGWKIRVNFQYPGNNKDGWFYEHQQTYQYGPLNNNGVKTMTDSYYEAVISAEAASYLRNNGINIHAQDMTVTTVEIIEPASSFDPSTLTWKAAAHGGLTITGGYTSSEEKTIVYTTVDNKTAEYKYTEYTLDSDNPDQFEFTGTGYIIITCEGSGLKASYMITVLKENQQRHWDFTKHQLVIGPAGDTAWRYANDTNWSEFNYNQHGDTEILHRYNGDINNTPNGDIIAEVNGRGDKQLWFTDNGRSIAIRNEGNEYDKDHSIVRFVAVEPNVTVHIGGLQKGDRVRMLIDKYGNDMELTFTNANDALGNPISGTYKVGGSSDFEAGVKDNLNAYYNFFVAENGEFTFTQTSTDCKYMKIFDIEVYRGDFIMSNEILSSKKQLIGRTVNAYSLVNGYQSIADYSGNSVIPEQDLIKIDGGYSLHHRGKDEVNCDHEIVKTSHNLHLGYDDFYIPEEYNNQSGKWYKTNVYLKDATRTMILNNQIFGSYILRIKLYDATNKYVTDYADRIVSIGYIEKVNHPITWDFTDLKTYLDVKNDFLQNETDYDYNTTGNTYYDENNDGYDSHLDLSIWKRDGNDWRLDFNRKDPNGAPFAWGTQLYAGTKMFDETRGIGFAPHNNNTTNYSLKITDGGLRIEDPTFSNSWGWELSIHDLDGLAAVYIRYEPIAGKTPYIDCQYNRVVDGTTGKPNAHLVYDKDVPDSNDKVQGHSAMIIWDAAEGGEIGSGCTNEFKIYLNNVILKKIGTSKDQKKIGKTGYATESRARDIDHSLTSYFTGLPITAYTGYIVDGDYSQVVFKEFAKDENHKVLPAATDGTNGGCILYHAANTQDKNTSMGLDGGIHLFVPDMHDTNNTLDVDEMDDDGHVNIIKAFKPTKNYFTFGEQGKNDEENYIPVQYDDNSLNFILSAKKYNYGGDGTDLGNGYDVFFIRIDPNGKNKNGDLGYAFLLKNGSYIQVPKDKVKELTSGGNSAKASIIFEDDLLNINEGIATGISETIQQKENKKADWYMLDGRKLNGTPTQKGLYIVNGKKLMVK